MPNLKTSFAQVRSHMWLFLAIAALQCVFFAVIAGLFFSYSQSIQSPLQSINDNIMSQRWMQEMPTEENLKDLNIPATDVAAIEEGKRQMEIATIKLYVSIVAFFVLFQGVSWALSYRIVGKQAWKETMKNFGRFSVVALFCLLAFFILIHSAIILLTKQFFTPNAAQTYLFMLPLFMAAILSYFIPIAFASVGHANLKDIVQRTIHAGIRKCLFMFSFYGAYVLTLSVIVIAMVKMTAVSFLLSVILGIALVSCIAFSRIVLIQNLNEKD